MKTRQRRNSRLHRLLLPIVAVAFLGYFSFWMFHGDYGVFAKEQLDKDAAELRLEIAELKAQRLVLERRISLLRPQSLDPDMVDERAREALNLLRPDELVIYTDMAPGKR